MCRMAVLRYGEEVAWAVTTAFYNLKFGRLLRAGRLKILISVAVDLVFGICRGDSLERLNISGSSKSLFPGFS